MIYERGANGAKAQTSAGARGKTVRTGDTQRGGKP